MRVLIFGTVYADTIEKQVLARQWTDLNNELNPKCEYMLVDSASPLLVFQSGRNFVLHLGDNIGHLARGGQDGWGRAFCTGLQWAIDGGYDYAVHVEGDSLCSLDVGSICSRMQLSGACAMGVPVRGTRSIENNWIETGLLFLDVDYARDSDIVGKYDWKNGTAKRYPTTPEYHVHNILGEHLQIADWRTMRDDCNVLTGSSVGDYNWITHARPEISDKFYDLAMTKVLA